jgi:membrane-associated protein
VLQRTRRKGRGVSVETKLTGIAPSQRRRQVVDPKVIEFPILQVDSPVSYLTAFFVPAFDAVCPVLPSETVIVALGVSTAGSVDPRIGLLIGLAAFGAFAGDNLCYFIGRRFSSTMNRHFFSGDGGAKKLEWADRTLGRFGARLIIACRFIPGGRTTVTLSCGVTEFRRRTFLWATAIAGGIWASYAFAVGRVSGKVFVKNHWLSIAVALAIVVLVTVVVEVTRRAVGQWKTRHSGRSDPAPNDARVGEA